MERKKITKNEKEENMFWEDAAKEPNVLYGKTCYPVKPLVELQELFMIGKIPSTLTSDISDISDIKGLNNLARVRKEGGDLLRQLWIHHSIFLANAAKIYFKKENNVEFEVYNKQKDNLIFEGTNYDMMLKVVLSKFRKI